MALRKVLITGSCGLVGSVAVKFFSDLGARVTGVDNNQRGKLFGKEGSVQEALDRNNEIPTYTHHNISVINKMVIERLLDLAKPDLIIHCAAQPSHEKSAEVPFEDFMINAVGTFNMLEAARTHCPDTPFIHVSTNKVYGDRPNQIKLREAIGRFHYDDPDYVDGIDENMSIDQSTHSPFGVSKAAADLAVQEFGRYFGMPTVCFRCGCITGAAHRGVEQHGFLNYLCKAAKQGKVYTIYGHKGKQVRDNIHAYDLVNAFYQFALSPRAGEVYNIGGGHDNSTSILEAIRDIKEISGLEVKTAEGPLRKGDHVCYYTNNSKFKSHYPEWKITKDREDILQEMLLGK